MSHITAGMCAGQARRCSAGSPARSVARQLRPGVRVVGARRLLRRHQRGALPDLSPVTRCRRRRAPGNVGWTREITLPGLPQIRTCGTLRIRLFESQARSWTTSRRNNVSRWQRIPLQALRLPPPCLACLVRPPSPCSLRDRQVATCVAQRIVHGLHFDAALVGVATANNLQEPAGRELLCPHFVFRYPSCASSEAIWLQRPDPLCWRRGQLDAIGLRGKACPKAIL